MKRHILTQIKNDWRENVWFVIELMVVFLVVWAMLSILYMVNKGLMLPRGFDPENVYVANTNWVPSDSPHHIATDQGDSLDLGDLVSRIAENEHVESAAVASSIPYNFNYDGRMIFLADEADSIGYLGNVRSCTPDFVNVLQIKSRTGSTREQLKEMLTRGEILISDNAEYSASGADPFELKGKKVIFGNDSTHTYRVGDVIEKVRRNDYEDSYAGSIIMAELPNELYGDVIIRIKPGHEAAFINDFDNKAELRGQRNIYLTDLLPMSTLRASNQRSIVIANRTMILIICFMLLTVFLGLLGSFWFRMQQRVGEIAIRKVCGATRRDVFRRVITEGMILLLIAVVPASACVWPFATDLREMTEESLWVLVVTELIALAIVAAGVAVSLWYPARRAMSVEPAVAIKAE